jgi:transcriptional regulator with XRE-family HTH domain
MDKVRGLDKGIGILIREKRKELGLSLKKVEELSGVNSSYINRIENGKRSCPSYPILQSLAKPLDLNILEILGIDNEDHGEAWELKSLLLSNKVNLNGEELSLSEKISIIHLINSVFRLKKWNGFGVFDDLQEVYKGVNELVK